MKKISVYLAEPQIAALHALANDLDLPMSDLIRTALAQYLAQRHPYGSQMPRTLAQIQAMDIRELTAFVEQLAHRFGVPDS